LFTDHDFEFGVAPRPGKFKYPLGDCLGFAARTRASHNDAKLEMMHILLPDQSEGLDAGAMKKPRHFARLRSNHDFF